jgi:hypothetical protein
MRLSDRAFKALEGKYLTRPQTWDFLQLGGTLVKERLRIGGQITAL